MPLIFDLFTKYFLAFEIDFVSVQRIWKTLTHFFLHIGGGTRTIKIDIGQDDEEDHLVN